MSTNPSQPKKGRIALTLVAVTTLLLSFMVATTGTADAQLDNEWTQFAGTAACIESDTVQNDPTAAGLSLGMTFVGQDGNRFTITNGGPTCTFTGAGCPDGLALHVVSHVKKCLAALNGASTTAPAAPDAPTSLAYTGSDTVLGMLGATMLGAGALLEAGRRKRENS